MELKQNMTIKGFLDKHKNLNFCDLNVWYQYIQTEFWNIKQNHFEEYIKVYYQKPIKKENEEEKQPG